MLLRGQRLLPSFRQNLSRNRFYSTSNKTELPFSRYSPFVDTPGRTLNQLKAYSFYYAYPHPEITPYIFLTTTLFNELGSIGILSYQMRNYPHRILQWTDTLLDVLPSFTESEFAVMDDRSKAYLQKKFDDPLKSLVNRRKNLLASTLYTVKDFSSARFASEKKELEEIDFDPESVNFI